ncbi:MAG TPA: hypothetical protein VF449_06460 [Parvibaculum sp.]
MVAASAAVPTSVYAGAWPQPAGQGQVITSYTSTRADEGYGPDGKLHRQSPYTKEELASYGEYGWTKDVTFVSEIAYTSDDTNYYGEHHRQKGLSRLELGARYAIGTWQDTLFSVQTLAVLHGASSGDDPASSRRGDLDGEIDIAFGRSFTFFGIKGFNDTLVGYRHRQGGRSDEVKTNITMGVNLFARTMMLIKSENFTTLTGSRQAADDVTRNKLGLSLVREITPAISLELGGMQTISGRNSIRERSLSLGLWYRF